MSDIVNGRIRSTALGIQDHGILTFWLQLEWAGGGQGLGGYALDGPDKEKRGYRPGWGLGLTCIRKILETVGVSQWEDLPGQLVRIKHGRVGTTDAPVIGHIIDDRWFDLKAFIEANKDAVEPASV
jgi:hypothetical protein